MHDARIGRFLSIDPLAGKYPQWSPYAFSGNRVIDAVELEGLEPVVKNGILVGYDVQDGQGPTQIAQDINNPETKRKYGYTVINRVHWSQIVGDNIAFFAKRAGDVVNVGDANDPGYRTMNINVGDHLMIRNFATFQLGQNEMEPDGYGGAGLLEYADEVISGAEAHTKGLTHKGGYIARSTSKTGKGLYWKPNARGLHLLKGWSFNVNSSLKIAGPVVGLALEIPEIVDGYQQSTHEGNKQVAGTVGGLGGGFLGGAAAGFVLGWAGVTTGPGVIVTVIAATTVGGIIGEEGVEMLYENVLGD